MIVDLRSDTVTRPTAGMRRAIADADVGDDVYGEDPTARRLEERTAELLGLEAALFVPTGTMANQIAVQLHARPGDEVLVPEGAHVVLYESGGAAAWAGAQLVTVGGGPALDLDELARRIRPDVHYLSRTSLVWIENTHNQAGGRVVPAPAMAGVATFARARGLALHLDGARIWNAAAATATGVDALVRGADTVSVCFSKGLGAPVGSAIAGRRALIDEARRIRKRMGGGMRQVGILCAAALYALEHHRSRLVEDHANAKHLASCLAGVTDLAVDPASVETNIVVIGTRPGRASALVEAARARGVLLGALDASHIRAVTHLDVSRSDLDRAAKLLIGAAHDPEAR